MMADADKMQTLGSGGMGLREYKQVGPTPESNSILKCILSPKRFLVQKSIGPERF